MAKAKSSAGADAMFRSDRLLPWVLVAVLILAPSAHTSAAPTAARHCGRALQSAPKVVPAPGMPEAVVEFVLNEGPAWQGDWPGSMGQYYATYTRAGLTIYYSAAGRAVRVERLWRTETVRPAPGRLVPGYVVVPGEGDW
jgi:hypothetical protein